MKREWILYCVIFVLAFLLLRQCNSDTNGSGCNDLDLKPDTVFSEGKPYPVPFEKEVYKIPPKAPDSLISEIIDSVDSNKNDTIRTYTTSYSDSLINGVITCKVKGHLINTGLDYTPLFPKLMLRVDTMRITQPVPVVKEKWGVYAGGIIGGSLERFSLQPALLIKTNKDLQFSVGYEVIGQTYNIGVFTKIKNPFKK